MNRIDWPDLISFVDMCEDVAFDLDQLPLSSSKNIQVHHETLIKYALSVGRAFPNSVSAGLLWRFGELYDNWLLRLEASFQYLYSLPWLDSNVHDIDAIIAKLLLVRSRFALTDLPLKTNNRYQRRFYTIVRQFPRPTWADRRYFGYFKKITKHGIFEDISRSLSAGSNQRVRRVLRRYQKISHSLFYNEIARPGFESSQKTNVFAKYNMLICRLIR
ncbi:hypothetical protein OGCDGJMD_00270 [Cyanobium usitatum str. Tous]|jgi:hypothetical protein|uniref:hypothetical protein n=1 Tax=Cyanobium usitatum TaxID=2304190 RepID=UPI002AD4D653|nr:hypothetical protein [Cyanobium usitatum]CAK6687679.1 hypothetical protein OGCDGJMD_00270 [Cyanobium usitatum str. Tous]